VISSKRNISLEKVFSYELSPVPASLFDEYGCMRKGDKSVLVQKIAAFTENHSTDVEVVDGNMLLHRIVWPKHGTVKSLAENFKAAAVKPHEVFIIFDKYISDSIKSHERERRCKGLSCPNFKLSIDTKLPSKNATCIMKNSHNKNEIIRVLCEYLSAENLHMIGEMQSTVDHEEADVSIITYHRCPTVPRPPVNVPLDASIF